MIDTAKLREAIKWARELADSPTATSFLLIALADAAESTLPKIRVVQVWHLEWDIQIFPSGDDSRTPYWRPCVDAFVTKRDAEEAGQKLGRHAFHIGVTGPYSREVPA